MGQNLGRVLGQHELSAFAPHLLIDELSSSQEIMLRVKKDLWEKLASD